VCEIDGNGATFLAARNEDTEILELLLHHGADADQVQRDGMGFQSADPPPSISTRQQPRVDREYI
jgi:ankyrin repeat protein